MPEPDTEPSYSPIAQHDWQIKSNREDDEAEATNDNEQLIENEETGTPLQQEPYMRATKLVSIRISNNEASHLLASVLAVIAEFV